MTCPDDGQLVAFGQGLLAEGARSSIAEHIDICEVCSMLVVAAAKERTPTVEVGSPATAGSTVEPAPQSVLESGSVLGRYMIAERLGVGGLGEVFTAYDPQLDRKVAIKVLRSTLHDTDQVAQLRSRLLREAQSLAKITHPNVVAVHDVGIAHGQVFIAMELVGGVTLQAWLRERERSWDAIHRVFMDAAAGLMAAHAVGVVHRDFKPTNVLVDDGRVCVLDFGLARVMTATQEVAAKPAGEIVRTGNMEATITEAGMLLGTPAYMPPEQIRSGAQDARGDQFSFCVAMYEALFGTRPFVGKSVEAIFEATIAGTPQPPKRNPRVPATLRRAIMRGLAADPEQRFDSMAALVAACSLKSRGRRVRVALVGAALVAGASAWVGTTFATADPTAVVPSRVDTLTEQARLAASRSWFVYPPATAPETPTAYQTVVDLEALAGELGPPAEARAAQLRSEFATTLVGLGDRYWDRPGGRPFAADYYTEALVFEPGNDRARERGLASAAQLQALQAQAAEGSFSAAELAAAQSLVVLAMPEQSAREQGLAALLQSDTPPSALNQERLVGLVVPAAPRTAASRPVPSPPTAAPETAVPEPAQPAPADRAVPSRKSSPTPPTSPSGSDPPPDEAPTRSADEAKRLAAQGQAALNALKLGEAEKLFHRALRHNPADLIALVELRGIYFQTGKYRKAIEFGRRAVRARPKDPDHHVKLGDLYMRVVQYDKAQTQYKAAAALGDARGGERLARLRAKAGD